MYHGMPLRGSAKFWARLIKLIANLRNAFLPLRVSSRPVGKTLGDSETVLCGIFLLEVVGNLFFAFESSPCTIRRRPLDPRSVNFEFFASLVENTERESLIDLSSSIKLVPFLSSNATVVYILWFVIN